MKKRKSDESAQVSISGEAYHIRRIGGAEVPYGAERVSTSQLSGNLVPLVVKLETGLMKMSRLEVFHS